MALLQISEPGQSTAPHRHNLACGIDLGTTNSLVASVMSGATKLLKDTDGEVILPSIAYFSGVEVLIGKEALNFASQDPSNTIFSIKRFMGISYDEAKAIKNLPYDLVNLDGSVGFKTAMGVLTPIEVSARILNSLKNRAEKALGDELKGAVITVPAYYDP